MDANWFINKIKETKNNLEKTLDQAVKADEDDVDKLNVSEIIRQVNIANSVAHSNNNDVGGNVNDISAIGINEEEIEKNNAIVAPIAIADNSDSSTSNSNNNNNPPQQQQPEQGNDDKNNNNSPPIERSELLLLQKREQQLQALSQTLASAAGENEALKDKLRELNHSWEKKTKALEERCEVLLKEGTSFSEKHGKAEQLYRKVKKEKEDVEAKLQSREEELKRARDANDALEKQVRELKDLSKRGEASILQITESTAESSRRLEEARAHAARAEKGEADAKAALELAFAQISEHKKTVSTLSQQLGVAKKEAEHAKFQLKEQLDSKQVQGARTETIERTLGDVRSALEEQLSEARTAEKEVREKLVRVSEEKTALERRLEADAKRNVELTRPLLVQIESLQRARDKLEEALNSYKVRVVAAETAEGEASAQRRKADNARAELAMRVAELEAGLTAGRADSSRVSAELALVTKRLTECDRAKEELARAVEVTKANSEARIRELSATEMNLRQLLSLEADKVERVQARGEEKLREAREKYQADLKKLAAHTLEAKVEPRVEVEAEVELDEGSVVAKSKTKQLQLELARKNHKVASLTAALGESQRAVEAGLEKVLRAEKELARAQSTVTKLQEDAAKNQILLEMLGEKEELVELLKSELEEVKTKFRQQLEQLFKV